MRKINEVAGIGDPLPHREGCGQRKERCQGLTQGWLDVCVLSHRETSVAGEQGRKGQHPMRWRSRQWLGF